MTSYAKKLITSTLFMLSFFCVNGKEIICYKLFDSSDQNIKVGAIQFISFIGDQCYESDINGTSVKNGTLQKNGYLSSHDITVYNGTCFCGSGAKLEFNRDKSLLIITSKNKKVFKFKKIVQPQGATTCSIIRKHNENTADGNCSNYVDIGNNDSYYSDSNNSYGNRKSSNTSINQGSNSHAQSQRKCAYCNGVGQITKNDNASANFGIEKPRRQCSTCGEWYNPNVFNHYHIRCSHCGGTGIVK